MTDDVEKLRYAKIVIATDEDVDGLHIRNLLLTFFLRYMKDLITGGHVYIGMPPLYKVQKGQKVIYAYDDKELAKELKKYGAQNVRVDGHSLGWGKGSVGVLKNHYPKGLRLF